MLPTDARSGPPGVAGVLGVNVRSTPEDRLALEDAYVQAVELACAGGDFARIQLFTTGLNEDLRAVERVAERLAHWPLSISHPTNVEELLDVIAGCSRVVCSRLHAAILALVVNVPVAGFDDNGKIGAFFDTVELGGYHATTDRREGPTRVAAMLRSPELRDQRAALEMSRLERVWCDAESEVERLLALTRG
jgi:polysaccharide pyruvyl transferase WcaK-like protein